MTGRTRFGWVNFGDCGELLCGGRFPPNLKVAVYNSYVWPAILCGSEACSLKVKWEFFKRKKDPW